MVPKQICSFETVIRAPLFLHPGQYKEMQCDGGKGDAAAAQEGQIVGQQPSCSLEYWHLR